jgi:DNA-binding transcriptional LysR family regulator
MNLSLERVLRFVAVAEQLSFTRAAALLGIDQPWLSRQVMQLEEQLGFVLFDRSGSRIALTAEGLEFFRSAQQLAESAHRLRQKAEDMSRRTQSVLRIGVSYATFPIEARHRLLDGYAAVRPNVSLEYSASEFSDEVIQRVISGEVDFGVVFGPVNDSELEVCLLQTIDITVGIPREDPLSSAPAVSLADLTGRRIAVGVRDRASFRFINAYSWIEQVGAIAVTVPEGRRFIVEVAARDRLCVVCYTPEDKLPPSMVLRPVVGPKPYIDVSLVRCKRVMSPAGERLWRLGQEMMAEPQITD